MKKVHLVFALKFCKMDSFIVLLLPNWPFRSRSRVGIPDDAKNRIKVWNFVLQMGFFDSSNNTLSYNFYSRVIAELVPSAHLTFVRRKLISKSFSCILRFAYSNLDRRVWIWETLKRPLSNEAQLESAALDRISDFCLPKILGKTFGLGIPSQARFSPKVL